MQGSQLSSAISGHAVVIIYSSFLPLRTGKIVSFTIKRSFSSLHTMSKYGRKRMSPVHVTLKRGVMDHACTLWDVLNCSMAISVALSLKLSLLYLRIFYFVLFFLFLSIISDWIIIVILILRSKLLESAITILLMERVRLSLDSFGALFYDSR